MTTTTTTSISTSTFEPIHYTTTTSSSLSSSSSFVMPSASNKHRMRPTSSQLKALRALYAQTRHPSRSVREELGGRIGMRYQSITNWFQNQRSTAKRKGQDVHYNGQNGNSDSVASGSGAGSQSPSSIASIMVIDDSEDEEYEGDGDVPSPNQSTLRTSRAGSGSGSDSEEEVDETIKLPNSNSHSVKREPLESAALLHDKKDPDHVIVPTRRIDPVRDIIKSSSSAFTVANAGPSGSPPPPSDPYSHSYHSHNSYSNTTASRRRTPRSPSPPYTRSPSPSFGPHHMYTRSSSISPPPSVLHSPPYQQKAAYYHRHHSPPPHTHTSAFVHPPQHHSQPQPHSQSQSQSQSQFRVHYYTPPPQSQVPLPHPHPRPHTAEEAEHGYRQRGYDGRVRERDFGYHSGREEEEEGDDGYDNGSRFGMYNSSSMHHTLPPTSSNGGLDSSSQQPTHPHSHAHSLIPRTKRSRPTPHQLTALRRLHAVTSSPTIEERARLGKEIGMELGKVTNWFRNLRQTARKKERERGGVGANGGGIGMGRIGGGDDVAMRGAAGVDERGYLMHQSPVPMPMQHPVTTPTSVPVSFTVPASSLPHSHTHPRGGSVSGPPPPAHHSAPAPGGGGCNCPGCDNIERRPSVVPPPVHPPVPAPISPPYSPMKRKYVEDVGDEYRYHGHHRYGREDEREWRYGNNGRGRGDERGPGYSGTTTGRRSYSPLHSRSHSRSRSPPSLRRSLSPSSRRYKLSAVDYGHPSSYPHHPRPHTRQQRSRSGSPPRNNLTYQQQQHQHQHQHPFTPSPDLVMEDDIDRNTTTSTSSSRPGSGSMVHEMHEAITPEPEYHRSREDHHRRHHQQQHHNARSFHRSGSGSPLPTPTTATSLPTLPPIRTLSEKKRMSNATASVVDSNDPDSSLDDAMLLLAFSRNN